MGIETTKALKARRRAATARVDRLIANADQRSPNEVARQARVSTAVRDGRRARRDIDVAERAVVAAQTRVGMTLTRLTDEDLSLNEAYAALGLSRAVGRRLVDLSTLRRPGHDVSTIRNTGRALSAGSADPDTGMSGRGDGARERNR